MLTSREIELLLGLLSEKYGFGYSCIKEIGVLQAKLSIMGEIVAKRELADAYKCDDSAQG